MIRKSAGGFCCIILALFLFSCASKPSGMYGGHLSADPFDNSRPAESGDTEETLLAIPGSTHKRNEPFSGIPPEIVEAVKTGSPESLKYAVARLRRPGESYTDDEAVLLNVAASMLSIVYPEETAIVNLPAVPPENSYAAAIDSARKGTYDYVSSESDVLLCVLPSLVLFTVPSVSNYYGDAETALKKARGLFPGSVIASYMLGLLYMRQTRPADAAAVLEPFCRDGTGYARMVLLFCEALRDSRNFAAAYTVASVLHLRDPDDINVLKMCAETSLALNDYATADKYVVQVLQKEPDNLEYVLFRAHILAQNHDYIKVSSLLDLYARSDKTSRDYLLLRAELQRDWNKNQGAVDATVREALSLYPDDREVMLFAAEYMSDAELEKNGYNALELAAKVLALHPDDNVALRIYTGKLMQLNRWQEAYEASTRLLQTPAVTDEMLLRHTEICIASGRTEEGERTLEQCSGSFRTADGYLTMSVRIKIASGDKPGAARLIESLLPSAGTRLKSSLYYERSLISASENQKLADLRYSLTANPRNKDSLFAMYEFYFEKKDYRKAQYYLKQVVALNTNEPLYIELNNSLEKLLER